ncbi:cell division protein SepF [Bacillus cereus]|uniref:cell division protein SepF n=1 Tax=Bacillus cereus group TaxID=86661 RepID=UPI000B434A71|nr:MULTISPECIES: cell division protein SepF [Bacillus cereus group]MEB9738061.1 cell division protein SepF [Bacillus cereus]OTW88721.1 cell division protein SepF [Bacillus thuringiensis serovar jinghongiensis]OTX21069.1 cell division protein SepF [Bacillus thuringiensis serovar japonensis]WBO75377.1 cell division protein SepF [Bacillus cereus]
MPKQLNIFDVEPAICEFDVMKANVKRETGRTTYADVRVQVPTNAKCTDELPRTTKQDDRYDIFEQYVMAIWRFQRAVDKFFNWDTAEELCKTARDKREIIPVRIYLGSGFKPDVVEYMR